MEEGIQIHSKKTKISGIIGYLRDGEFDVLSRMVRSDAQGGHAQQKKMPETSGIYASAYTHLRRISYDKRQVMI